MKFRLSIQRVMAIIKLKSLEHKMVAIQGFRVNRTFVSKMESYLGSDQQTLSISEPPTALAEATGIVRRPPCLVAIPKDETMSPADAAKILGRKLKPIYQTITEELAGVTPYSPFVEDASKDISQSELASLKLKEDPYETSRWQFVFRDTSAAKGPSSLFIRERNGTLRYAHPREVKREEELLASQKRLTKDKILRSTAQ
jgi:hypothetical protein